MLHLAKLAVGTRDVADLRAWQAKRALLRHLTRNTPRRREEILAGGSLYWVVNGAMVVRQRVLDIAEAAYDDGSRCCALVLDRALVPVLGRPMRPFQGWRYLEAEAAPLDVPEHAGEAEGLPEPLLRQLRELCLI
ncbi:MAG: DUF1489 domain-containing protein [Acetobacteraceae bacterium]|nr:DUF1489 domain-containing protein [Acetobacteraceae bacterium]